MRSTDSTPVVSVIVPVYNAEKYLNRCVDSILNQTYRNIEVILVDDGSTDRSDEICDLYSRKDSRVTCYHTTNNGAGAARNFGLSKMRPDGYVTFVDSDDWIAPQMYETLITSRIAGEADIVGCNFSVDNETTGSSSVPAQTFCGEISQDAFITKILCAGEWGSTCDKIFHKELWKDEAFPRIVHFEDFYVLIRISKKAKSILRIKDSFYHYMFHENSQSHGFLRKKRISIFADAKTIHNYIRRNHFPKAIVATSDYFILKVYSSILYEIIKNKVPYSKKRFRLYRSKCLLLYLKFLASLKFSYCNIAILKKIICISVGYRTVQCREVMS